MTIMNPKRSIDGAAKWLAAGGLVTALCVSLAAASATAIGQERDSAPTPPAAAPVVAVPAAPAAAATQPDAAVLIERARKKIKVDHDVAGAVAAYREVIEKHRADLAHARPALRELLDLWVEVQGNTAAAAAIRPAAEKYLDMQRPIDPKAAAARTDDDLARDLLLKPWLVTLKFDKAPLKEVLAEITRQSGVAIKLVPWPQPFDTAKYRAVTEKLTRYAELPERERKLLWDEMVAVRPNLEGEGDPDEIMREAAAELAGVTAEMLEARIQELSQANQATEELARSVEELARSGVTIDVTGVTALAAIDAVGQVAYVAHDSVYFQLSSVPPALNSAYQGNRIYQGRSTIWLSNLQRTTLFDAEGVRHSRLTTSVSHTLEPGLPAQNLHVRSAVGIDSRGRKFVWDGAGSHGANTIDLQNVPAEVQEFDTLTGECTWTVITEGQERRLPLTKGNRVETPEGTLTVQSIDTAEGETVVTLAEARKDMGRMGVYAAASTGLDGVEDEMGSRLESAGLELANGKRMRPKGMSRSSDGARARTQLTFNIGSAEPTALIWTAPTKTIPIVIPFEFKHVKLP